jgi:hypothetical protein
MAREAKTIITAEDKTGPGIKSAINNVLDLDGAAKKLGKTFATSLTAAGLVMIGKQVADFGAQCYAAFAEAERAAITFSTALADRTDVSRNALEAFNDSFSKSFGVDGEAIMGMETMLLASGRTEDQITKMMNAAQALSVATGKDLATSVDLLNKSFSGSEGKLGTLIPALKDLTDAQLRNGQGVDVILEKFGHLNATVSEMADTKLKNLKNSWEDLTESIGGSISTWVEPVVTGLTRIFDNIKKVIDEKMRLDKVLSKKGEGLTADDELTILADKISKLQSMLFGQAAHMFTTKMKDDMKMELEDLRRLYNQIKTNDSKENPLTPSKHAATSASTYIPVKFGPSELDKMLSGLATLNIAQAQEITDAITTAMLTAEAMKSNYNGQNTYELESAGAPLPSVFDNIISGLGSFVGSIGGAIGSLASVQQILNPITTILAGMMEVIGPVINELLTPLVGILRIIGKVLGAILVPVLKQLTPVIDVIMKAFIWLYNYAIMPLANAIIWVISTLYNGIAYVINGLLSMIDNINILGWSPDVSYRVATMDYDALALKPISEADVMAEGNQGNTDTTSAANNASYTGSRSITFNFYNQGNVVGAGGLEELAAIINALIQRDARYA